MSLLKSVCVIYHWKSLELKVFFQPLRCVSVHVTDSIPVLWLASCVHRWGDTGHIFMCGSLPWGKSWGSHPVFKSGAPEKLGLAVGSEYFMAFFVPFLGVPFPKNFMSVAKTILKRLFRVYAHIYHQHFDPVIQLQEEAHLNTSFKHFIFFVQVKLGLNIVLWAGIWTLGGSQRAT